MISWFIYLYNVCFPLVKSYALKLSRHCMTKPPLFTCTSQSDLPPFEENIEFSRFSAFTSKSPKQLLAFTELEFLDAGASIRWSAVAATMEPSAVPLFNVWKSFDSWEKMDVLWMPGRWVFISFCFPPWTTSSDRWPPVSEQRQTNSTEK